MKLKSIFVLISLLFFTTISAQNFNIKTSIGFSGLGSPFDGYYYSFDVGIPILKAFEITPTFTTCSDILHNSSSYSWNIQEGEIVTLKNDIKGRWASSYELFIYFNPYKLFKKKNIDMGIGFGYGFKTFSNYRYNIENNKHIAVNTSYGFRKSSSMKLYFNRHFKKYFLGIVIGANDLVDLNDTVSIFGIQLGIKID